MRIRPDLVINEQYDFVRSGLAEVLTPDDATADAISTAAKRALTEPNRAALGVVRDEIAAMPAPSDIVETLTGTRSR